MLGLLFLVFIVLPIAELWILVRLGQEVGFWLTLAIVLGTGALGAALAKSQGLRVVKQLQAEVAAGRVPHRQLLDGIAILLGGTLLLTPGFITDLIGLGLLFPPTRRLLQTMAGRWLDGQVRSGGLRVSVLRWQPGEEGGARSPTSGLDPAKEIRIPARDGDAG